jgi:hypothetical protein
MQVSCPVITLAAMLDVWAASQLMEGRFSLNPCPSVGHDIEILHRGIGEVLDYPT